MFLNKRKIYRLFVHRIPFPPLSNIDRLRKDKYDDFLIKSIQSATLLKSLEKCEKINGKMFDLIRNQNTSTTFKFIFEQQTITDLSNVTPLLPCFGLFPSEPFGLYRGILTFSSNKYQFYLVGSKTPLSQSISLSQ